MPKFRPFLALIPAILILTSSTGSQGQTWSGVLTSSRAADWTTAGIAGGIPSSSWTQCGATIAPYSGSASTIVNALNHTGTGYTGCGANTYVQLGAGTFNLTSAVYVVGANNTELRGMGADQTHLVYSSTSTCSNGGCLVGFASSDSTYPASVSSASTWSAGYTQGSNTITLSSGANIAANQTLIVLDQCDTGYTGSPCSGSATDNGNFFECADQYSGSAGCSVSGGDGGFARPHRWEWEIVQATSCSPACGSAGTTNVTITPALQHPNWASGQTPQAWLIQPSQNVGFRDFSVDGSATQDVSGVSFYNTSNFWATGIAVLNSYNIGIWIWQGTHGQIESNYVYNAGQNLAYSDAVSIKHNGANNLIDNNILEAGRAAVMAEGSDSGSVIAYNFAINQHTGDDFMYGAFWQHSAGDDYELFEGNVGDQAQMDEQHGSHLADTYYRNFFTGFESCANGQCGSYSQKDASTSAVEDTNNDRYANFVANVLGTPGWTSTYTSSTSEWATSLDAFVVGSGNAAATPAIPLDPLVGTTMMRWGNYDVVNGSPQWVTSAVPSVLNLLSNIVPTQCTSTLACPGSFFMSTAPPWWTSGIPFPAIGPDVNSGNVGMCAGTFNTSGQFAGVAATNASQCKGTSLTPAWAGHVNAIPAMACYLNAGGAPDGSGSAITFSSHSCYGSATTTATGAPPPPSGLSGTLVQ